MNIKIDTSAQITVSLPLDAALAIHKLLGKVSKQELINKGFSEEQNEKIGLVYWSVKKQLAALSSPE